MQSTFKLLYTITEAIKDEELEEIDKEIKNFFGE